MLKDDHEPPASGVLKGLGDTAKQSESFNATRAVGDANQQPVSRDPEKTNALSLNDRLKADESSGLVTMPPNDSTKANGQFVAGNAGNSAKPSPSQEACGIRQLADTVSRHNVPLAVIGAQSAAMATPEAAPTGFAPYGAETSLLALGHQAVDGATHKTRPLASPATQTRLQTPVIPHAGQTKSKSLRRGKWTVEEEAYVARVIQDFNSGFLNAPAGTTLRSYLSEKLQCDPMRITKKFTGDSCIGKRVFHPAVRNPGNAAAIDKAQAELDALERRWRRRLEMQQRESAKKAAASAAAAAAASGRSHGFITQSAMGTTVGSGVAGGGHPGMVLGGQNTTSPNVVTRTASWLDRASNILKETGSQTTTTTTTNTVTTTGVSVPCTQQRFSLTQEQAQALQSLPQKEIEMQMKEVERLIHEGPIIQQTTAGLPLVLHQSPPPATISPAPPPPPVPTTIVASTPVAPASDGQQTPPEPADKRMRTGAEDAEALVGFLTAVRASAAAGTDSFSS